MTRDEDVWFEPKRRGYGAGLPISWQGWAAMLCYFLILTIAGALVLPRSMAGFLVITTAATAAFLVIAARKTRGGWRWRSATSKPHRPRRRSASGSRKRRMDDDLQA